MINYRYPVPFLPISGQVIDATSTKLRFRELTDLAGTVSVGIYDHDTQAVATAAGSGKKFFIGYSSEHTRDFLDKYQFGAQLPRGNSYWSFKGSDVLSFEYSDPNFVNNERWIWGWSGSDGCNDPLPKFECGKPYGIRVRAYGNEISKRWNGDFIREFYSDPIECTTDPSTCTGPCPPEYVDPVTVLKSIAHKINTDYETKQINLKARVLSSNYAAQTVNMHIYQIVLTDAGDNAALAAVQQTVPKPFKAERVNRVGLQSVYHVCANALPAAFQPQPNLYISTDCDGCNQAIAGANYFDVYTVTRTVAQASDIDTPAEQTALAATIATAYGGTNPQVVSASGTTFKSSFQVVKGSPAPPAQGTDTIAKTGDVVSVPMPATVAWTQLCDAYRTQRNLCITLQRVECTGADRLQELKDYYADVANVNAAGITKTAGTDCEDTYQITQYSTGCMQDTCLAADTAVFEDLGSYDESLWTVIEPAVPAYDPDVKAGLEISISFPQRFVADDEFDPWMDNTDLDPVRLELTIIYEPFNKFPETTKVIPIAKRVSRIANVRQSGFSVLNQYLKSGVYEIFGEDYQKPRLRRVLDANRRKQVERDTPYRLYYLQFKVDRGNINWDQKPEVAEAIFAVPFTRPDKMAKLEAAILAPLSRFGVTLEKRDY